MSDVNMRFDLVSGQFVPFQSTDFSPESLSTSSGGVTVTRRDTTIPEVTPEGEGTPAPMPRPRGDLPPEPIDPAVKAADDARAAAASLAAENLNRARTDSFSVLKTYLAKYQLSGLEGAVRDIIFGGTVDLSSPDAILFSLREQPDYVKRFAGNQGRVKNNLAELDPGTYIGMENQYRQLMQSNGFDKGFYDDQSDFEQFIAGDVSISELQTRIEQGFNLVRNADPAVKAQMKQLYGVGDEQLAEFFLDQKRALPLFKDFEKTKKARAAGIAARGFEQGGIQLEALEAEGLVDRGITAETAADRFASRKSMSGLYDRMTGEEALTREQELGATFGFDTDALLALQGRQKKRVAQFQGGGRFAGTTGATSGTVETGVGSAQ